MFKENKKDQIALLISGLLFLVSLAILLFDLGPYRRQITGTQEKIGTLESKSNTVKRKFDEGVGWDDITDNEDIFKNDQIFTHDKATAEILLLDKTSIKVAPNSLIKLELADDGVNVDLQDGYMFAKIGQGGKGLKIRSGDKTFQADSENAEFQIADGTVSVSQGKLTLEIDGKKVSLGQDQYISLLEGAVKSYAISIKRPVDGGSVFLSAGEEMEFSWTSKELADGFQIIIGKDKSFKEVVAEKKSNTPELKLQLAPGPYFWKVIGNQAKTSTPLLGRTGFFHVKELRAPKILYPKAGDVLALKGKESLEIKLAWEDLAIEQYDIELEMHENAKVKTKTLKSERSSLDFMTSGAGEISFRVAASSGKKKIWGEWTTFYIGNTRRPEKLMPEDMASVDKMKLKDWSIPLQWQGPRGVYAVQISKRPEFENLLVDEKVNEHQMLWNNPPLGRFYWRVGLLSSSGIIFSETQRLDVVAPGPILVSPRPGVELTLLSPHQPVIFEWEPPPASNGALLQAKKYIIEIAKDSKFEDLVEDEETNKLKFEWKGPELGSFYWRIRPIYGEGLMGPETKAGLFIKKPMPPRSPPISPEIELEIRKKGKEKEPGGREISSISDTYVSMNFPELKYIKQYVVEIYENRRLSDSVLKTTLQNREFFWEEPDPGTYYLRYAVVDSWGQQSDWSDVSRLVLNYDPALLDRPDLGDPSSAEKFNYDADESIDFEWDLVHWAKDYDMMIGNDPNLATAVISKSTREDEMEVAMAKIGGPGTYYWKVVARNGKMVKSSKVRSFYLINPEPVISPKEKLEEEMAIKDELAFAQTYKRVRQTNFLLTPSYNSFVYKQKLASGVEGYSGRAAVIGNGGQVRYQSPTLWAYELDVIMLKTSLFSNLVTVKYNDFQFFAGKAIPFNEWIKMELLVGGGQLATTALTAKLDSAGTAIGVNVAEETYRAGLGKLALWFYTDEARYHIFEALGSVGGYSRYGGGYTYSNTFWSSPIMYQFNISNYMTNYTSTSNTKGTITVTSLALSLGAKF